MKTGDHEHKAFEAFCEECGLDNSMHPLHLIYLNEDTAALLKAFKAGYAAKDQFDYIPCECVDDGCKECGGWGFVRSDGHSEAESQARAEERSKTLEEVEKELQSFRDSVKIDPNTATHLSDIEEAVIREHILVTETIQSIIQSLKKQ